MFIYGKTSANAIAVMSFLAADPKRRAGSGEIAKSRNISRALTAKLLTQLAAAGLVRGQPGPGGGYTLAKPPGKICLLDIASLFEQTEPPSLCPFGPDWCGKGSPCPLHDTIGGIIDSNRVFMKKTSLAIFAGKTPRMPAKTARSKRRRPRGILPGFVG